MANFLGTHCIVPGCGNALRKLNNWKAKPCPKPNHKGKSQSNCTCPEPYRLFKFPIGVKLRKMWLERVGRLDLEVNNMTRICSMHFFEKKPTRRNYFPTLNLRPGRREENISKNELDCDEEDEEVEQLHALMVNEITGGDADEDETGSDRGTVSLVPMELLQEPGNETEEEEECSQDYGPRVTISKVAYTNATPVSGMERRPPTSSHLPISVVQPKTTITSLSSGTSIIRSQGRGRLMFLQNSPLKNEQQQQRVKNKDFENGTTSPYTIMESGCDDSSELSDIGIDIMDSMKHKQIAKPKVKSQQGFKIGKFQPVITRVQSTTLKMSEKNGGSLEAKQTNTPSKSNSSTNMLNSLQKESETEMVHNVAQQVEAKPMATYDPTKQQLQITNPVKYIQECHTRIAQLIADKQQLANQNAELESKVQKLQQENGNLRREVAVAAQQQHTATPNRQRPVTVTHLQTPTFDLVPIQAAARESVATSNNVSGSRIRYVIRRPAALVTLPKLNFNFNKSK